MNLFDLPSVWIWFDLKSKISYRRQEDFCAFEIEDFKGIIKQEDFIPKAFSFEIEDLIAFGIGIIVLHYACLPRQQIYCVCAVTISQIKSKFLTPIVSFIAYEIFYAFAIMKSSISSKKIE